jgi:hypothetical protein
MPENTNSSRRADLNEKMIELRIRLWTNKISDTPGEIIPKHAWDAGVVYMQLNSSHGIGRKRAKPFHTLMDLPAIVEKVLIAHGVKLHHSKQSKKYFVTED